MFGILKWLFVPQPPQRPAEPTRQQAIAQARAGMQRVMTPERADLIANALKVRAAKQTILADMSDVDRQKLVADAMRFFLSQAPEPEPKSEARKPPPRTLAAKRKAR
jgi:hypothetical protein